MASISKQIKINKLVKENMVLNIQLSGLTEFKIRLFIAKIFLRIIAFIIGCGIEIKED